MPASNNDHGSDELSEVQIKINQKTNESLESTRNMLTMAAQSQEIGVNTMIMLDEQGEKLNRVENGLNNVHAGMDNAEENLNNLQKCCGLCHLPWNRRLGGRKHQPFQNSSTTVSSETSSPTTTEPKLRMADDGMPTKGYITRITNDDREVEMDDNLQIVSSYLGNLKNIALDMGDTITNQNKQIDRIGAKTEVGVERVEQANKKTQELIRKA